MISKKPRYRGFLLEYVLEIKNMPVDVVITWVDGRDRAHQDKLAKYIDPIVGQRSAAASPTRFNECGELTYCVLSILQFAPWVRTIFIVTDDQIPPVFNKLQDKAGTVQLKRIDHRELFKGYEQNLPTFNSITIESMLWRIPGLSERFIYFNDDCLLVRPVQCEDFFRENKMVVRGEWKTQSKYKWQHRFNRLFKIKSIDIHRALQEKTAALAGNKKVYLHLPHAPFALQKNTFETYFSNYPSRLENNIKYRLRDPHQFWPIALAQQLALTNEQALMDNRLHAIMVNGAFHDLGKIKRRLNQIAKLQNIAFLCMQSIDSAPEETQNYMLDWLKNRFSQVE